MNGTVKVSATGVDAFGVHDANVNLDAAVTDDRVDGSATITVGDIARVSVVTSKLTLPKHGALRLAELRGELLVSSSVDLSEAARLLPDPIGYDIDGRAFVDLRAKLGESNPRVRFELRTLNLEVTERVQGGEIETRQEALRRQPLAFHGLDLDLRGELTPEHSRLSGKVLDEHGPLLRLQLGGDVPLPALLRHPNEAARRLAEVRYEADVELPRRELSTWPARFRPPSLLGKVSGHGKLRGTLRDPSLSVRLQGEGLHSKANRRVSPATLRASLSYADGRGNAGVSLSHGDGEMSLTGDYSASWSALLAGRSPELRGDVRLTARNYALDRIPILSAREFRGRLSGTIVASGLGTDPRVEGRLQLRQLHVARVKLSSAEISMKAGDGDLHAEAHLAHPGGNLNATLDAGIRWQKELLPKLDDERVLSAQVKAKSFRAGTFLPLVSGSVAKLDGRIDADLSARIGPGERTLSGSAELSHGVVQVPAIGQELHAIHGKLRARKDGTLYLDDVSARGLVGRVRAAASARLRGFELVAFSANAKIDEGEKIPLTLQGVSLGNMWGRVHVDGRTTGSRDLDLKVDVASFHLEMPSLTPRSVQSLEPAEHVRVGVRHDDGTLTVLPLQPLEEENPDPTTLRVKVTLGNDVWLRQDTTARVKLDGAVTLDVAKAAAARGTIHLTQGRIDVSGKLFEIVNGTVTFDGDVSNPTVVATARWESPDGVVVFAEFSGPVKSGNLHLRSDPALGESQILALLLFGSTDGMIGAGSSSDGGKAATAASVGGGIATKGLNAAFRRLTDVDVTARIDTSDSQQPRPELAVQVTRRVTAKVGYNIGEPAPGKAPDRTQFTLDFRLSRRWSLATTFGDRGSSLLELLWRYRY